MSYPTTLSEKKSAAIVSIANDVAAEDPQTADHAARISIVKKMLEAQSFIDRYIVVDFAMQSYDDSTTFDTVKTRLSSLLTNMVALGFG
jgi:hypothetical protein